MAEVAFPTARLVIDSVLLLILLREFLRDRPGARPHGWVLDRRHVVKRGRIGTGPALDHMQVLARAAIVRLRAEVGDVDHQRVAFPAAARVAEPLADPRWQM